MANYYTKETLKVKVQQLQEATGTKMTLVPCNGEYAVNCNDLFSFLGWYHSARHLIIYIDGILGGIKFKKQIN